MDSEEFDTEYDLWLETMEAAMKRLDQEGVFDINQERDDVIVLVEVMPPGYTKELLRNNFSIVRRIFLRECQSKKERCR